MNKIIDFIKCHKTFVIVAVVLLILIILLISGSKARSKAYKEEAEENARIEAMMNDSMGNTESDNELMQMQGDLQSSFGKAPKGFVWDVDGSLISLGDTSMTAEEVVYAYFRGLASLDMSTAQKYSRASSVIATYSRYFDTTNTNTDYTDQFARDMYKACLLSMQITGIDNVSVFAADKEVFTVKATMLDLTDKDFWLPDQMKIYKDLYVYNNTEADSTKSDIYLYDYISSYYKSELAKRREVTFDVTVQKYPDLNSGWLVSIDSDVDTACQYKDGKLVVSYIREQFRDYGMDMMQEQNNSSRGVNNESVESTED